MALVLRCALLILFQHGLHLQKGARKVGKGHNARNSGHYSPNYKFSQLFAAARFPMYDDSDLESRPWRRVLNLHPVCLKFNQRFFALSAAHNSRTGSFDLLVYTKADCAVPAAWEESDPKYIAKSNEVRLRSFTTKVHKVDTMVSYSVDDC